MRRCAQCCTSDLQLFPVFNYQSTTDLPSESSPYNWQSSNQDDLFPQCPPRCQSWQSIGQRRWNDWAANLKTRWLQKTPPYFWGWRIGRSLGIAGSQVSVVHEWCSPHGFGGIGRQWGDDWEPRDRAGIACSHNRIGCWQVWAVRVWANWRHECGNKIKGQCITKKQTSNLPPQEYRLQPAISRFHQWYSFSNLSLANATNSSQPHTS